MSFQNLRTTIESNPKYIPSSITTELITDNAVIVKWLESSGNEAVKCKIFVELSPVTDTIPLIERDVIRTIPLADEKIRITDVKYKELNLISIANRIPKSKAKINIGNRVLVLSVPVPENKLWYLTSWSGSGTGKGYFSIVDYSDLSSTVNVLDNIDSATNWTIREKVISLTLDTSVKKTGVGSLKVVCDCKNNEKTRFDKTYTQPFNLSTSDEILVWIYGHGNGKTVTLKLWQGSLSYEWAAVPIREGWGKYSFPLEEISTFDKTAVTKFEFIIYANGVTTNGEAYWFDEIEALSDVDQREISSFYTGPFNPYQQIFPIPIKIESQHFVRIFITNLDSSINNFECEFNGREVDNV